MKILYRESQKFNQWWVWLLLLGTVGGAIAAGAYEYASNRDLAALLVSGGVAALTLIAFALLQLKTTITEDGIEVKFWPFGKRRIFRAEIVEARVRKYSPIGEYGGWGYRMGPSGKAYNTMGNQGLQLRLKDGEKILIGTQNPEALSRIMDDYMGVERGQPTEEESLKLKPLRQKEKRINPR